MYTTELLIITFHGNKDKIKRLEVPYAGLCTLKIQYNRKGRKIVQDKTIALNNESIIIGFMFIEKLGMFHFKRLQRPKESDIHYVTYNNRNMPELDTVDSLKQFFQESICRDQIGWLYIQDQLYSKKNYMIAQYYKGRLKGFCIFKVLSASKSEYFIELLCTQENSVGLGKHLMDYIIKEFCGGTRCKIKLKSVPSAALWYESLGFVKEDEYHVYSKKTSVGLTPEGLFRPKFLEQPYWGEYDDHVITVGNMLYSYKEFKEMIMNYDRQEMLSHGIIQSDGLIDFVEAMVYFEANYFYDIDYVKYIKTSEPGIKVGYYIALYRESYREENIYIDKRFFKP